MIGITKKPQGNNGVEPGLMEAKDTTEKVGRFNERLIDVSNDGKR